MPSIAHQEKLFDLKILIISGLISLLLILVDNIGLLNGLKNYGNQLASDLSLDSRLKFSKYDEFKRNFIEKEELINTIENKESEINLLISENSLLIKENKELEKLKKQNTFNTEYKSTPARVNNYISDRFGHIVINKGVENSVSIGDALVLENYLLGEIIEVQENTSIVKLISSTESSIAVVGLNNNARGLVIGDFSKGLIMEDIPINSKIDENELIVTAGVNSTLPNGLILGKVKSYSQEASLPTKTAQLDLLVDLNSLTEVFVLSKI